MGKIMEKTVLIAEDYADVRSMTRMMVETCGYRVVEAQDGYEALEAAKERRPDMILMDIAMPLMNGITYACHIRTIAHCDDVPIIALTAYGNDYLDHADEFGFDQVVQKPVQIDDLRTLLSKYLSHETEH
jgi:CheY-like chemotaxis protein